MSARSKAKGRARNSIDTPREPSGEATLEHNPVEEEQPSIKQMPSTKQKGKVPVKRARSLSSTSKTSAINSADETVKPVEHTKNTTKALDEEESLTPVKKAEEETVAAEESQLQPHEALVTKEEDGNTKDKNAQEEDSVSDTTGADYATQQSTKGKKKIGKKKSNSKKSESTTSGSGNQGSKPVYNIAGVNLTALFADCGDVPPLYNRRNRRATRRQRCSLDVDSAVFAQHCDLRSNPAHTERRKVAQLHDAPLSTEEDVLASYTEWRQPPELLYAHLLWRYVPKAFLQLAMEERHPTT